MVCEKGPESTHDFKKDPLKLILEGDYLRADDTTLGGDDGAAVCMMLMILKDRSLPHPACTAPTAWTSRIFTRSI